MHPAATSNLLIRRHPRTTPDTIDRRQITLIQSVTCALFCQDLRTPMPLNPSISIRLRTLGCKCWVSHAHRSISPLLLPPLHQPLLLHVTLASANSNWRGSRLGSLFLAHRRTLLSPAATPPIRLTKQRRTPILC